VIWLKDAEKRLEAKTAKGKKTADDEKTAAELKKMREKRETWIATLKAGRSPFDDQTLMDLRREEGGSEGE
jgi:hypothetical protein